MAQATTGRKAIVLGASGGIGAALVERLRDDPRYTRVEALHRHATVPIDYDDEDSIAHAAEALQAAGPFDLVVNAVGVLHTTSFAPEKRLGDLRYAQMIATFKANTFGPALVLRHFAPLLADERSVVALLSARVGSIGDNRLGGWYSYRASKAALNMIVRTAAIEMKRTRPGAIVVALHPGTVGTALSRPFRGDEIGRVAASAATDLLEVVDGLRPEDSGTFLAYDGTEVPW